MLQLCIAPANIPEVNTNDSAALSSISKNEEIPRSDQVRPMQSLLPVPSTLLVSQILPRALPPHIKAVSKQITAAQDLEKIVSSIIHAIKLLVLLFFRLLDS
jgi:hypothetical protein